MTRTAEKDENNDKDSSFNFIKKERYKIDVSSSFLCGGGQTLLVKLLLSE